MIHESSRRRFLQIGGAAAVASLAGCQDSGSNGAEGETSTDEDTSDGGASTATASGLEPVSVDEEWALHRFDQGNTGYSSNTGPTDEVEVRWHADLEEGVEAMPALADGRLFVGSAPGVVHALDPATGEEMWSEEKGAYIETGPVVVDETVYITVDETLYALDAATGEEQWTFTANRFLACVPTVAEGTAYVRDDNHNIYAFDADSGEKQWQLTASSAIRASFAYGDETLFVPADSGLQAIDVTEPEFIWSADVEGEVVSGPAVVDGTVYIRGHHVHAFDAGSGEQEWVYEGFEDPGTTPAVRDGVVFTGNRGTEVALDSTDGTERWRQEINGYPYHTVTDDGLYVSTKRELAVHDPETGDQVWSVEPDGFTSTAAVLASGLLFVGDNKGLTAYQEV